jgi:exosortase
MQDAKKTPRPQDEPARERRRRGLRRATLKDWALALLVFFLIAQGPLTPAAVVPSVIAGVGGGLFFLYWRLAQPLPLQAEAPKRWEVPLGVWLCLGLFAAAAAPTAKWMYDEWTGSVWHNTHGMLMPVLMVLLGRNILRRMKHDAEESSAWGFAFLLPGLALMALDSAAATHYVSALGIVICLPGLSLLLLGPKRTRALALPLTLGLFMIPLPNTFASQIMLRTVTAHGVAPILTFLGIPTLIDHTLLELPTASFLVANACSGFSTLYSAIAMGVLLGSLCPSRRRRWIVFLSIVPLALAANVIRVVILVFVALYLDQGLLDTSAHAGSGVLTFLGVLIALILLSQRPPLARALL